MEGHDRRDNEGTDALIHTVYSTKGIFLLEIRKEKGNVEVTMHSISQLMNKFKIHYVSIKHPKSAC